MLTYDLARLTHRERIAIYLREGRPVSGAKGSKTDQDAAHSTLSFQKTLMDSFQAQFGAQKGILDFLTAGLMGKAQNPEGIDAATKARMETGATEQNALQVQHAEQAAQASAAAHGGAGLPSGVQAQVAGQIAAAGNSDLTGRRSQIDLLDAQLKQQNYWKAISGLGGVAAEENPLGYAGANSSNSNALANLSNASNAADSSGFLGSFSNSFGSTLGHTLAGGNASPSGGWLGAGG